MRTTQARRTCLRRCTPPYKATDQHPRPAPKPLTVREYQAVTRLLTEHGSSLLQVKDLPDKLQTKLTASVRGALAATGAELEQRLFAYFGVPVPEITRRGSDDAAVVGVVRDNDDALIFDSNGDATVDAAMVRAGSVDFDEDMVSFSRYAKLVRYGNENDSGNEDLRKELAWCLLAGVWQDYVNETPLGGEAHYLPAGRSGLLEAWSDVVQNRLLSYRDRFGRVVENSDLGGVALDFVSSLAGVLGPRSRRHDRQHSTPQHQSLALLQELMGGKIVFGSPDNIILTANFEQNGNQIPVRRASAMVNELAPLAMWIDQIIKPGDVLIIDEPEAHLHPEAVRLIARVLVRLVNENVRVVCSTHSSTLLHELSNCLLRNRTLPTAGGDVLDIDDIAVHRFHRRNPSDPVKVEQVDIDPDWGIPEDEHFAVAAAMSDETADLVESLP